MEQRKERKQHKVTEVVSGKTVSTFTAAGTGTFGYGLWNGAWKFIKDMDMQDGIEYIPWASLEPLLDEMYIFLALGGAVMFVHGLQKIRSNWYRKNNA